MHPVDTLTDIYLIDLLLGRRVRDRGSLGYGLDGGIKNGGPRWATTFYTCIQSIKIVSPSFNPAPIFPISPVYLSFPLPICLLPPKGRTLTSLWTCNKLCKVEHWLFSRTMQRTRKCTHRSGLGDWTVTSVRLLSRKNVFTMILVTVSVIQREKIFWKPVLRLIWPTWILSFKRILSTLSVIGVGTTQHKLTTYWPDGETYAA